MEQSESNLSVMIPADIDADFALIFRGKGMKNARIYDGDTVFIKETTDVKDGDIVMAVVDGACRLRKYQSGDGNYQYALLDTDCIYPAIIITPGTKTPRS